MAIARLRAKLARVNMVRDILGKMKPHVPQDLVVYALRRAWFRWRPAPGLIMHSDRREPVLQQGVHENDQGVRHASVDAPQRRLLG